MKKGYASNDFRFHAKHGAQSALDRAETYETKFKVMPGARSALQGNSEFMNKIEGNDVILPLSNLNRLVKL